MVAVPSHGPAEMLFRSAKGLGLVQLCKKKFFKVTGSGDERLITEDEKDLWMEKFSGARAFMADDLSPEQSKKIAAGKILCKGQASFAIAICLREMIYNSYSPSYTMLRADTALEDVFTRMMSYFKMFAAIEEIIMWSDEDSEIVLWNESSKWQYDRSSEKFTSTSSGDDLLSAVMKLVNAFNSPMALLYVDSNDIIQGLSYMSLENVTVILGREYRQVGVDGVEKMKCKLMTALCISFNYDISHTKMLYDCLRFEGGKKVVKHGTEMVGTSGGIIPAPALNDGPYMTATRSSPLRHHAVDESSLTGSLAEEKLINDIQCGPPHDDQLPLKEYTRNILTYKVLCNGKTIERHIAILGTGRLVRNGRLTVALRNFVKAIRSVSIQGNGAGFDTGHLDGYRQGRSQMILSAILEGKEGIEPFRFVMYQMMRGLLKTSPRATTACFIPESAHAEGGMGNSTLISESLVRRENFVTDGVKLYWRDLVFPEIYLL